MNKIIRLSKDRNGNRAVKFRKMHKLSHTEVGWAEELIEFGMSRAEVARKLEVSRCTLADALEMKKLLGLDGFKNA